MVAHLSIPLPKVNGQSPHDQHQDRDERNDNQKFDKRRRAPPSAIRSNSEAVHNKGFALHVVLFQHRSYSYSVRDRSGKTQLVKRTGATD